MKSVVYGWLSLLLVVAVGVDAARAEDKAAPKKDKDGWISLFNGKNLDGWKANEKPENWTVEDGCIVGKGDRSHLFYVDQEFSDLEFEAEINLAHNSNSGMFFRTAFGPEWPKGYEAQVNNTHADPKRTGTLYYFDIVEEQLVEDDTWWTQRVVAKGNHIQIFVNDKKVVDFKDKDNTYTKGHVALQQHDPGSTVRYRNLRVKPLD